MIMFLASQQRLETMSVIDGVWCPIKLGRGLFPTSPIDNIDHNPSSNMAQGSFHGTGISLFQNISEGNPGCEGEAITMANNTG